MRITLEKNLAFADQPKPILYKDIPDQIKPRKAIKPLEKAALELNLNLSVLPGSRLEAVLERDNRVKLRLENFAVGKHVFPPDIKSIGIDSLGNKSERFNKALETDALLPDHLDFQPVLPTLPEQLRVPPFFRSVMQKEDWQRGNPATTVFPPDNRMVFSDTSYPWCTCGRVDSPLSQASGVMVGPRHLLTASHCVQWNSDGSAGWLRFRPAYFAPSAPFGDAWAVWIYYKMKVTGPTIDWVEGMYDYVVCVLDRYIGNWTGWMGAKGYTDAWDGGAYWSHIGYPGDLTSGNRPTFQGGIALDGSWWQADSHEAMSHRGDVWPGQSGGPFFGWWGGMPYVVAVQSSHNANENNASGGQDIIFPGRKTYPRLLIKRIFVSGRGNEGTKLEGFAARATVEGITSEPVIYGKPLFLAVNAAAENIGRLDADGRIDRTRPDYQDYFRARLSGFSVPELPLPKDNKYLPAAVRVQAAEVRAELTLDPDSFLLDVTVDGRNLVGDYQGRPEPEDLIQEIVREALAELDLISLNYRLRGVGKELSMELHSNLDDVVRERIKAVIGRKLEEFVTALRARVEAKLRAKQAELNGKLNQNRREMEAKLQGLQEKMKLQNQDFEALKKKFEAELGKDKGKLKLPGLDF